MTLNELISDYNAEQDAVRGGADAIEEAGDQDTLDLIFK